MAAPPGALHGLPADDDPAPEDSLEALTQRMADLCAGAVDPFEVAAALESDGINDEGAGRYGHPHVFALAEDLYERTERRPAARDAPPPPWGGQVWRQLLRGALFGLPGLCYATVTSVLTSHGAGYVLMLSLLLSWSGSQGVAYLGYVRLGRGDRPGAARVLRRGLTTTGLVVVPVVLCTGGLLGTGWPTTALAVAQCVYLLAATVALVGGGEPWLLLALLPGAVASTVQLAGAEIQPVVWAAWAVTIAATVGLAVVRTGASRQAAGAGRGLNLTDAVAALPYALFGLLAGGLLTFSTVSVLLGRAEPSSVATVAVLALSLSMGVAESILVAYRRRTYRALLTRGTVAGFTRAARAALVIAISAYLVALAGLTATIAGAAALSGHPLRDTGTAPWIAGGHLALGGAFFVALLLQSCGRVRAVLLACAGALTAEAVASGAGDPWVVQCVVACGLFCALSAYTFVVLGRATAHR